MTTIKEYCISLGGTPSGVLDIYNELQEYIGTQTGENTGAALPVETIIGHDRPSERELVTRSDLRTQEYFQILAAMGKDAVKKLYEYSNTQLKEMADNAAAILKRTQGQIENVNNDLTASTQEILDEKENLDDYVQGLFNLL